MQDNSETAVTPAGNGSVVACCHLCKKEFGTRGGLIKHLRSKHGLDTSSMRLDARSLCDCYHEGCRAQGLRFRSIAEYRRHLERQHGVAGITVPTQLVFDSAAQLQAWKAELELRDVSRFVLSRSAKRVRACTTWQYECNRSGAYKAQGHGKRRIKSQGSCKSGFRCPATLVIVHRDNRYHVTYHPTHYGHEKLLSHIGLSTADRERIAGQLAQGVPADQILHSVRTATHSEFNRAHLITRRDLNNIRKAYGIKAPLTGGAGNEGGGTGGEEGVQSVADEALPTAVEGGERAKGGVDGWVGAMQGLGEDENPVVLYKRAGEALEGVEGVGVEGMGGVGRGEEVLVLLSPLQRVMLARFGRTRLVVDTAPAGGGQAPSGGDLVPRGLELTALLVVDDYEEGFPVAFLCSSAPLSTAHLTLLFCCVRRALGGALHPHCLVTDDPAIVQGAWEASMGAPAPPKHQLYTQHVDRAWRGAEGGGGGEECRQAVDRSLRGCQGELRDLRQMLQRGGAGLGGGLDALLALVLDKQLQRLSKLHHGRLSSRLGALLQTHAEGAALAPSCIPLGGGGALGEGDVLGGGGASRWEVSSSSDPGRVHVVQRSEAHACSPVCHVVCRQCGACVTALSCTCDESHVHGRLCKHAHAVSVSELRAGACTPLPQDDALSGEASDETQLYMHALRAQARTRRHNSVHALTQEIAALSCADQDTDPTVLAGVLTYLRAARGLLTLREEEEHSTTLLHSGKRELSLLSRPAGGGRVPFTGGTAVGGRQRQSESRRGKAMQSEGGRGQQLVGVAASAATAAAAAAPLQQLLILTLPPDHQLSAPALPGVDEGLGGEYLGGEGTLSEVDMDQASLSLRRQFEGQVAGLEPPQLCLSEHGFTLHTDSTLRVVQLHNTGAGHWLASTRAPGVSTVVIYDPLLRADTEPELGYMLQQQLVQLYRHTDRELRVALPPLPLPPFAPHDCAILALALATDLCCGLEPAQRLYDPPALHAHLRACIQQEHFTPCAALTLPSSPALIPPSSPALVQPSSPALIPPVTGPGDVSGESVFYGSIPLYCYCRGLGDDNMVECGGCLESFHCACVEYTGGDFRCASCLTAPP